MDRQNPIGHFQNVITNRILLNSCAFQSIGKFRERRCKHSGRKLETECMDTKKAENPWSKEMRSEQITGIPETPLFQRIDWIDRSDWWSLNLRQSGEPEPKLHAHPPYPKNTLLLSSEILGHSENWEFMFSLGLAQITQVQVLRNLAYLKQWSRTHWGAIARSSGAV